MLILEIYVGFLSIKLSGQTSEHLVYTFLMNEKTGPNKIIEPSSMYSQKSEVKQNIRITLWER